MSFDRTCKQTNRGYYCIFIYARLLNEVNKNMYCVYSNDDYVKNMYCVYSNEDYVKNMYCVNYSNDDYVKKKSFLCLYYLLAANDD